MARENVEQQLCQDFPAREEEISILLDLMCEPDLPSPPAIFCYGHSSFGKTSLLKAIAKRTLSETDYAFINCVECFTPRLIFERVLNSWSGVVPHPQNGFKGYAHCDSLNDFVVYTKDLLRDAQTTKFIFLDRAERLRDMGPTLLPVLLRLRGVTSCDVCVIFITTVEFAKFRTKGGMSEPIIVKFSEYSRGDTLKILAKDCPPSERAIDEGPAFFGGFCELIYDTFNKNCKDLNELRHLVSLLFPIYVKPVIDGDAKRTEAGRLFKLAQPYFIEAVDKLYLRQISSVDWLERAKKQTDAGAIAAPDLSSHMELPYYTKFLLIAAFLASYNPPKMDKRYFSKGAEERKNYKRKVRPVSDKMGGKMRQQLLGPKAFPLERMLAIFYSIIDEPIENTIDMQTQISTMITLRLLMRMSGADKLDNIRCKCNVSFSFIQQVAKSVRFDVGAYLFDFH